MTTMTVTMFTRALLVLTIAVVAGCSSMGTATSLFDQLGGMITSALCPMPS
jgi:hypothetical protein